NREAGGAHAVPRMWKSQTNEDGKRLSKFERDALIERHCELFGGRNKQLGVYCSFHAEKRLLSVSIKTVRCPDCKLVVPVTGTDPDFRFVSDVTDWKRLCERPHRGDPVGSLLWRLRTNLRRKE